MLPPRSFSLAEVTALVGGSLHGDPSTPITGINGIKEAAPGDLTFVRDDRYWPDFLQSPAAAALTSTVHPDSPKPYIVVPHPEVAFLEIVEQFLPPKPQPEPGIHPTALIHPSATLAEDIHIGPYVVIGERAVLQRAVVVHAQCYIGADCTIGAETVLYPQVVLREGTRLGARCIVHAHATLGTDGFGFVAHSGTWRKIPQIGRVVVEDDVEIGSGTCIDRATFGETRVGRGTKIDNLVQIGHNAKIGEHCVIAGMVGIAGSATIGNNVRIGARAGIAGHIRIGDGASIGGMAVVMRDVDPEATVSGWPATDHRQALRILMAQQHVPEMLRRIRRLEREQNKGE